ncbi:uncharacterized protein LOC120343761 isoform X2 [Styela clava]
MRIQSILTCSEILLFTFSTLILQTTGVWSPWSDWSACSVSCGKGEQMRVRICLDNSCEVPERQLRECGKPCDDGKSDIQQVVKVNWEPWSDWSVCSVSCGKGKQMRIRICTDNTCQQPERKEQECGKPCPQEKDKAQRTTVKVNWGPWSDWSVCSVSCGKGKQMRVRICTDNTCQQPERQEQECGKPCPQEKDKGQRTTVKVNWRPWSDWSVCSVSCGKGKQMRVRICTGNTCQQPERQEQECGKPCPQEKDKGQRTITKKPWLPWSDWSACTVSCGRGQQMRIRLCLNNKCQEPEREQRECGKPCKEIGNDEQGSTWQPWSPWNLCSTVCGSGMQMRVRQCSSSKDRQPLENKECGNDAVEVKSCNDRHCVVGGFASEPAKWPWQVLIITNLDGQWQQCGGTLISSSWILSAAHCFLDPFGNEWNIESIMLGTTSRAGIGRGVVKYSEADIVHTHENFDNRIYVNDISLVKLPSPVVLKRYIKPAKLPKANVAVTEGTSCVVTGWGATNSTGSKESIPDKLQEVDVNIFTDEDCRKMHHTPGVDGSYTKSHFCAGHLEGKKDTCGGDSGGPLVCKENGEYIVHGITSSGPAECGKKNKPGIYTRVSDFVTWIGRTIEGFRYHWSKWKRNKCSVTCGRGQRTETRTCLDKDEKPATECDGISTRNIPCRNAPCIEYHWTPWKTTCSVTCNEGVATSTRYCADANKAPTFPNNCPGQEKKYEPCVMPKCIEYNWTPWVSTCSVTCGEGTETSTRKCVDDKNNLSKLDNCVGKSKKIGKCVKSNCIEYNWTPWVSTCSVTCGEGNETSTRKCVDDKNNPSKPDNCVGKSRKTDKCVKPDCKPVYHWSTWSSICSVTCGTARGVKIRSCLNNNNKNVATRRCPGDRVIYIDCTEPPCSMKYHWGEWSNVSECSASCGTGEIEMKRKCLDSDNVEVLDSSKCNPGKDVKLRTCNLKPCPVYKWSQWKTSCSVTCGTGVLTKTRNCVDQNGNTAQHVLFCGPEKSVEKDTCVLKPCPVQTSFSWGSWSTWCSVTCGNGGMRLKTRKCYDDSGQVVSDYGKCKRGKRVEVGNCPYLPCTIKADEESSTPYNWGQWGSWSPCRRRIGSGNICSGFKASTRDCLIGSEDVNPRRCSDEYPGEDYYRESSCGMKTSNCP